jgi:hypothetical protein
MAKKKLLNDFEKNILTEKQAEEVKGGKSYVPGSTGSVGFINWEDIDVRGNNFFVSQNNFPKLSE